MSSAQSSTTNSNTTSVANIPNQSTAASTGLNPAEFTKEYLGQQPLDKLKLIKKTCGFRKKTETHAEFVDAIHEWYQKNHAPKSATETPKTRKPRAKKESNPETYEASLQATKKKRIEFAREYLKVRTVEQLEATKEKHNIPGDTEEHSELVDIIYNWYEAKYAAENLVSAGSLVDSIRAEVADDAAGISAPQTATKEKKPKQSKAKKATQSQEPGQTQPIQQKTYKTPLNIIHKVNTGIVNPGKNSLTPIQKWLKEAHNYLYGQENIVGEEAMNDIMCLLFLSLIQPYISETEEAGKFDLLNIDKYIIGDNPDPFCRRAVNTMQQDSVEGRACKQDFTNFIKLQWEQTDKSNEAPRSILRCGDNCIIKKFGRFLTIHPQTKDIFTTENFINCKQASTIIELLKRIRTFVADHVDKLKHEDLIGEIYEYFINNYHKKDNKLGQFFTPRKMMLLALKFKENEIRANLAQFTQSDPNEKINVWDPCMGTGGWLISAVNLFGTDHKDGKQVFNINPAGNDVKKDTLQMGIMNVMNVKPNMQLERFSVNNSLTNSLDYYEYPSGRIPNQMHLITTNPPFGASGKNDVDEGEANSKGKKDKISSLQHEYKQHLGQKVKLGLDITAYYNTNPFGTIYNLNDKNMPIQFLELCIHRLIPGGMCMIVLPYGELFFSERYAEARTHLMSVVNITDIFLFPSGVFTHTGIKSCCLVFRKDNTGTKAIKFYKANQDCNELTEIVSVTRDEINADPIKSWYLNDYLEDVYIRELMGKLDCEWVPFGEVFDLVKGTLQSSKVDEDPDGDGVFITKDSNSDNWMKFKSKYNDEGVFIACVSNGNHTVPINYYKGKYDYNNLLYKCIPTSKYSNINMKYIYYYMIECKKHIEELYQKGACTPSLDDRNFLAKFKIPLPSLDIQRRVVHFYDTIEEKFKFFTNAIERTEKARDANFELSLWLGSQGGDFQVSNIGTVCKFINGTSHNASYGIEEGLYPFYTSSNKVDKFTNTNDYEPGEYLIMGDGGTANVNYNNTGFGVSNHCYVIQSKEGKIIKTKYLYNYIRNNLKGLQLLFRGIGMENINQIQLQSFQVVIPPLEFQEQLINETECFENDIEFYRRGIKNYTKIRANKFLAVSNKKFYEMFPDGAFGSTLNPTPEN